LSPRENIANEGSYHDKKEEDNSDVSGLFVKVRPVVETSPNMHIDADEEERCTVSMHISN